ncbi:MAG: SPOR domain-containing protein [Candidatus Poribacteria bacterium]|nr:SPOR domain-containing protein [Candidatus Poribacteria bacterium]
MRIKTLVIICFVVLMLGNVMITEGSSGIDHRDIFVGASARAVGMGSAFTAGPSANNGFLWNPSSLGFMNGLEVNMGGIPFSGEPSGPDQAFSLAASPYSLGLTNKNVGNLSLASWFNGWNNSNSESTQIVLLGYGMSLNEQTSAGANLRYYQNNTPSRTNFLWSVDMGMQFTFPLETAGDSVTFGINLSELSNGIRENGELIESLPLAARFGTTYRPDSATLLSADFAIRGQNDTTWGERLRLHFGAERWLINNHIGIRLGYTALTDSFKFSQGQWSQGISFQNSSGQLDYAHVRGGDLDQSLHWITATLRWGGSEKQPTAEQPSTSSVSKIDTKREDTAAITPTILMPKTLEANTDSNGTSRELQLTKSAISPNGDGVADSTVFNFIVRPNDKWRLILSDAYTEQVWEKSGTGTPTDGIVWNGIGTDGNLVDDGDYVLQLHIIDAKGNAYLRQSKKVIVDLIPTTLEFIKKGSKSVGVKAWDINVIADWKLEIFDADDNLVEESEGKDAPPETIVLSKVPQLATTTYRFELTVNDIAGNQTVQQAQMQFGGESVASTAQVENDQPKLTLMVGSFGERRNANLMADNLKRLYPNETVKIYNVTINGNVLHRVTIGSFIERSEATSLIQQIQESQGVEPVLIRP